LRYRQIIADVFRDMEGEFMTQRYAVTCDGCGKIEEHSIKERGTIRWRLVSVSLVADAATDDETTEQNTDVVRGDYCDGCASLIADRIGAAIKTSVHTFQTSKAAPPPAEEPAAAEEPAQAEPAAQAPKGEAHGAKHHRRR
jgi:hypothetical protein